MLSRLIWELEDLNNSNLRGKVDLAYDFAKNSSLRTIFKKIQLFQFYLHISKINEFWQRKISSNWAQIWHIGISLCAKQSTKREIRNFKKSQFSPTLICILRRFLLSPQGMILTDELKENSN